jgi:hypothetical protein
MNPKIKRAFLDTEDGQILYRIGGEGEPLLLLHMNPRRVMNIANSCLSLLKIDES